MDTSQLKAYAPQARRAFIAAVSAQAARIGITVKGCEAAKVDGDVLLIAGQAFPKEIEAARRKLVDRVRVQGFEATMEAMAYTWFNRFVAIRYMELHGYLDHGYQVLGHPKGPGRPQILDYAADVSLPGLDREKAIELKLDGTGDEELYQMVLKAQCNALHEAMPFLFERIGDETELLLPANLLHTDSLVRQMVEGIDESDWEQIEIVGWLYQFYISEKKDQVIGKVVKSEDIPAATQLFTPNWIVKYMVQNTLGAQWLATYPHSPLKGQMEYYIEPAEQTEEVKAQLAAITPSALNPEELTLIDPACGSGHILVEAYEIFKAIYLERGYRQRDVAKLILEKNLFGLDIDERAVQLTGFALMMKGRADDRRMFERGVKLNVMALVDSTGFDAEGLASGLELGQYGLMPEDLMELKQLFEHATTFGSLIKVPKELAQKLPALKQLSEATSQDLFVSEALKQIELLMQQAELLKTQYDAVVANPPYMGGKGMNTLLKKFAKNHFPDAKSDLFGCFIERSYTFGKFLGHVGIVAPYVWMFISSYERLRDWLIDSTTLTSLIQLEYNAFEPACIPVATFTFICRHVSSFKGSYIKLSEFKGHQNQAPRTLAAIRNRDCGWFFETHQDEFKKIPGSPLAYWVSSAIRNLYTSLPALSSVAGARQGIKTGDNERFLRFWQEVSLSKAALPSSSPVVKKWFPCSKGGDYRKWFGNCEHTLNWEDEGHEIRNFYTPGGRLRSRPQNVRYFFREGATWSTLTSSHLSVRLFPKGFAFESKGSVCFPHEGTSAIDLLGSLNSKVVGRLVAATSATLDYSEGAISRLPWKHVVQSHVFDLIRRSRDDWNAYERSWDFQSHPLLTTATDSTPTLASCYNAWITRNKENIVEMKRLEEENNRLFIDAYGLADELTPDIPIEQITLTVNPAYRYGGKLTEEEQWTRFRQDSMQELVSYATGCMMGRYSLDSPGLIYAHSGNKGFDPSRYTTFPADEDGIIPLNDTEWFDDDAAHRLIEFISVAWDKTHLEANLTFLADNLSPKKNESSRDTIRRYLCDKFFKDHLKTYKKRPIYWLFSSGKQKACQCLVYLHRYNEGTLSRMRSEYVIPLQGKMAARIEKLQGDIQVATSTAHRKQLERERTKLEKQQLELLTFDEKLRHYADMRISLDLDDGVKVNYGKFGDLLAEAKAVHGKKPEGI